MNPEDLLRFDREHLWHPYSSITAPGPVYPVVSASGVRLRLNRPPAASGTGSSEVEVIDAMSSWWAAVHGYAVPELDAAVHSQLGRMSHVMFGGLTHEPAVRLAGKLIDLIGLDQVFFADSGSVAVEVAMKMAWQAHAADGLTRTKFFTLRGGYHGDTFSPMSVTDPDGGMHSLYAGLVPEHVFAPLAPDRRHLDPHTPEMAAWEAETVRLFEQHAHEIAAVIVEPILQGAGGMRAYHPHCLDVLTRLARTHGALVIHDEIATGFWRTGKAFGRDHAPGQAADGPDIVCVGKALTGGYLSLGAVLCSNDVAQRVSNSPAGALMHGPTFMANPLACAVAGASLDLLHRNGAEELVSQVEAHLVRGLADAQTRPGITDVRVLGAVGVLELDCPVDVPRVTAAALDRGVWVRPFRNLVYTMPPYICTPDEIDTITTAMIAAVEEVHG